MEKMFYLSLVYDINGYDRLDLITNPSLKEIDDIISEFSSATEVKEAFLSDLNINKRGRICLLLEDLKEKEKQLNHYNCANEEDKERIKKDFSYVHMIPVKYKNTELLGNDSCLYMIKRKLKIPAVLYAILFNQVRDPRTKKIIYVNPDNVYNDDGVLLKTNKKYLLNEKELSYINDGLFKEARESFITRLNTTSDEELYFIYRALMSECKLFKRIINTKFGRLVVFDNDKHRRKRTLTQTEILEEESKNMDDFWTYHDLDEIIKYSKDENKPITSERRNRL